MDGDVRRDTLDAVLKEWVELEMCLDFQLPVHDIPSDWIDPRTLII